MEPETSPWQQLIPVFCACSVLFIILNSTWCFAQWCTCRQPNLTSAQASAMEKNPCIMIFEMQGQLWLLCIMFYFYYVHMFYTSNTWDIIDGAAPPPPKELLDVSIRKSEYFLVQALYTRHNALSLYTSRDALSKNLKKHHGVFFFILHRLFANLSDSLFMCSRLQSLPRIWRSWKWHNCFRSEDARVIETGEMTEAARRQTRLGFIYWL
jgi:hypothetical protein